jgi:hypothetical protein
MKDKHEVRRLRPGEDLPLEQNPSRERSGVIVHANDALD